MMFSDAEGRKKIMRDLQRMDHVYKHVDKPTFEVVKIEKRDAIYEQMSDHFKKNLGSLEEEETCNIENVYTINNYFISYVYNDAFNEMERKLGKKPMEELLFHGTSDKAIASIIKNNFDADASPTVGDNGHMRPKRSQYGRGIYFCSSSATASKFGNNIVVCKVIIGNCETISLSPPSRSLSLSSPSHLNMEISAKYDSRKVMISTGVNVFVIKETHHILPYCVITTKRKNLSWSRSKFLRAKSKIASASSILARSISGNMARPTIPPPSSGQSGPTS